MITIEELQDINKIFSDGKIVNNNVFYAIVEKSVRRKISHLLRALVVDHTFSDGNKRTAYIAARVIFMRNNIGIYKDTLVKTIIKIARENITDINTIEELIARCIKK